VKWCILRPSRGPKLDRHYLEFTGFVLDIFHNIITLFSLKYDLKVIVDSRNSSLEKNKLHPHS
jgi:hypothetical protein